VNGQLDLVKISSVVYLLPYTLRRYARIPGQFEKATFTRVATHFDLDEQAGVVRVQSYENDGSITSPIAYIALAAAGWT
jgi:hypothetical protein